MKSEKQNNAPPRFFCDTGRNDAANFLKRLSQGFERPLKLISMPNLFAQSDIDAINLPFEEAIRYFRDKANVKTRHWYDVYGAAASRSFWVAGAATDALVEDFRQAIDKAIADGTSLAEFRKDFDNIVARNGWKGWKGEESAAGRAWRTRIIYETNLRAAYSAGRYAALTKPETLDVFPYWQYNHSGSSHPRLEHLSWDGLVLRADDTFWQTNYPPNGWHCGCYVTPVSNEDLKRQGKKGPDTSPDLLPIAQDVGGKSVMVPKGVDAGFEYNPGLEWLARTAPGKETIAAAPRMIEQFVASIASKTLNNPGAYLPVALAPKEVSTYFNVETAAEIRLIANRVEQHLKKHLVTTPYLYSGLIEYAVSEATIVTDEIGRLMMITEYQGKKWIIGIRCHKKQLQVTTVHETSNKQIALKTSKGNILRKGK